MDSSTCPEQLVLSCSSNEEPYSTRTIMDPSTSSEPHSTRTIVSTSTELSNLEPHSTLTFMDPSTSLELPCLEPHSTHAIMDPSTSSELSSPETCSIYTPEPHSTRTIMDPSISSELSSPGPCPIHTPEPHSTRTILGPSTSSELTSLEPYSTFTTEPRSTLTITDSSTSSELSVLNSSGKRRSTRLQATPAVSRDSLTSVINTPANRSSGTTAMQSSQNTPQESVNHKEEDASPTKRTGLRRKRDEPKMPLKDSTNEAMKPLTDEERRKWTGWVELESDPAHFNFILRECGVKDVKVQEVLGLDEDMMSFLSKPVYGLIFLFKYWKEEDEETEELPKCPNHVWFANQTITNACATISLLNIVMNIPKIDLGENLSAFKAETKSLKPAYRGQTLGENEFIRNIHNSFARRMDILNSDLSLSNDFDKWKRAKNAKKRKVTARKTPAKAKKKNEEEPGFHFIAYVPINGMVWRLDGMQRQPMTLGEAGNDWMAIARENINLRIAQYDDGLSFNLLSLCRSPLQSIPEALAENLHSISAVEKALSATLPDWKAFIEMEDESSALLANEPNDSFAITKELITHTHVPDSVQRKLQGDTADPMGLMDLRRDLLTEQKQLQAAYVQEAASVAQEHEQTERRRIDYTPIIYDSIKELAEKGVLKDIIRDLVNSGYMK